MIRSAGAPGFPLAFTSSWQSSVWAKTAVDRASLFEQALAVSRPVSSIPATRATPAPASTARISPVVTPRQASASDRILTARTPELAVSAPVATPRGPAATGSLPAERTSLPEPAAGSKPPLAILADEFSKLGLDPETLQLTETRETIYYPGGSYENHLITATYGNGLKESVSVPLMMRNPRVSVADLLRPLGLYI